MISFKPKQKIKNNFNETAIMIAYCPLNSGPRYLAKMIVVMDDDKIENPLEVKEEK